MPWRVATGENRMRMPTDSKANGKIQTPECIPDSIHQVLATQGYFSRARVVKRSPEGTVLTSSLLLGQEHLAHLPLLLQAPAVLVAPSPAVAGSAAEMEGQPDVEPRNQDQMDRNREHAEDEWKSWQRGQVRNTLHLVSAAAQWILLLACLIYLGIGSLQPSTVRAHVQPIVCWPVKLSMGFIIYLFRKEEKFILSSHFDLAEKQARHYLSSVKMLTQILFQRKMAGAGIAACELYKPKRAAAEEGTQWVGVGAGGAPGGLPGPRSAAPGPSTSAGTPGPLPPYSSRYVRLAPREDSRLRRSAAPLTGWLPAGSPEPFLRGGGSRDTGTPGRLLRYPAAAPGFPTLQLPPSTPFTLFLSYIFPPFLQSVRIKQPISKKTFVLMGSSLLSSIPGKSIKGAAVNLTAEVGSIQIRNGSIMITCDGLYLLSLKGNIFFHNPKEEDLLKLTVWKTDNKTSRALWEQTVWVSGEAVNLTIVLYLFAQDNITLGTSSNATIADLSFSLVLLSPFICSL
ncbi:uncharacterized protein ACIBXB_019466 [Morphnus guianensis]